ncbi:hypothetical protein CNEO2_1690001 [Clostridium neonatale]|uniref:Uncharacterized protein n=8 Tax=Clostridium TaxID=1485 RepID=A0AAD1YD22_9CLOT|nr:hypothetical protein CNEO2_1750003 [Clostridium neonatale]CAI3198467.1 hypothetical protein CNEO2_1800001 [Clostridium neonatale]CAI3204945.1 hypothetical protein CNEO2_2730003 [Clostridium neonatale]CAI3227292.1 hypothetical protein CNEO2_1670001 [Clostridium neonatale]CAI3228651.1 hypothetical protein CNEO2_1860001 [Clostridium neonatale]
MISKLVAGNVVSKETLRSWLPRIENPVAEGEKLKKEFEDELPHSSLDDIQHDNEPIRGESDEE